MSRILKGAEPVFYPGGKTGILLVHGFTGTPFEMHWLGEQLAAKGYTVLIIRLFGHATSLDDLIRARYQDWLVNVEDGYNLLRNYCDSCFIAGLSLGGALSLHSAAELPWRGVISMSAPFGSPDARLAALRPLIPLISKIWRFSAKGESDWNDPVLQKDHIEYPVYPIRTAAEVDILLQRMRKNLIKINIPALLIHSKSDRSVPYLHAERIRQRLTSSDKKLVTLEKSGHGVTRDVERELVLQEIETFIQKCLREA